MSKPKYFLYARKSTEDDDKQVMSIEAQLFELREFARKENLQILEEFTESKSAKKPGREQFNNMMMRIEQMDGVGILAWHPDRLARNSVDGGRIIYAVDTHKIIALRFPTFWFEPTPQGLFMLQVAFGQSKYYSDNLKQNVERGMRQKVRRGEWLTKAPYGYANNLRTRNIDPDPVKSRVIVSAFKEYATGRHGIVSLAHFLAEHGVTTKAGTLLAKASVVRMLSNRAYLGLIKHHDEWHQGSFEPILSAQLFEAVQKVLKTKQRPRKSKPQHDFPLTGLFHCGECGSMITAQWATGKCGGRYRYYRCTKKRERCSQGYLREDVLVEQVRVRLQTIALCDADTERMLAQVQTWEREETSASQHSVDRRKEKLVQIETKLDALVNLFLDEDIEKATYLSKKDELLRERASVHEQLEAARKNGKNWVEPLRKWIIDMKKATELVSSDNLDEMREFLRMFGSNPVMRDKSIAITFSPPSEFVSACKAGADFAHPLLSIARKRASEFSADFYVCDPTENRTLI